MTFLPMALNHIIPKSNTEPQMSLFSSPSRKILDSADV